MSAYKILQNMKKDGMIVQHKPDNRIEPDLWSLKGARQPSNWYNRDHEIDCADLFISYKNTNQLAYWASRWEPEELHPFGETFSVYFDRRMELEDVDQVFFFEVDRGTEDLDTVKRKVEKYVALSNHLVGQGMTILFTVQGYRWTTSQTRLSRILSILRDARRGNQFLIAPHEEVLANPLGKVWISPVDGETKICLNDLV